MLELNAAPGKAAAGAASAGSVFKRPGGFCRALIGKGGPRALHRLRAGFTLHAGFIVNVGAPPPSTLTLLIATSAGGSGAFAWRLSAMCAVWGKMTETG
jgi:UDP-N-acetylenolpyruvoylglucosamine reductase